MLEWRGWGETHYQFGGVRFKADVWVGMCGVRCRRLSSVRTKLFGVDAGQFKPIAGPSCRNWKGLLMVQSIIPG